MENFVGETERKNTKTTAEVSIRIYQICNNESETKKKVL